MNYRNTNTGEVFTLEELKEIWEQFGYESKHDTFEDMLEDLGEIPDGYVIGEDGELIHYGAAVMLMDDEIREQLHTEISPCTDQEFYDEYCKRHYQKYGEDFEV